MATHESVDRLYDEVRKLDLTMTGFAQIIKDYGKYSSLQSKAGLNDDDYKPGTSLLYLAATDAGVKYADGLPTAIVHYNIICAIGTNTTTNKPITPWIGEADFDKCTFFEGYFACPPADIRVIKCVGNCVDLVATGAWCYKCHCGFNYASSLSKIMHKSVKLQNVPKESIYYIEENLTPIDWQKPESLADALKLMQSEQKKLEELAIGIAETPAKVAVMAVEYMSKMACDKETLEKELSVRGGSMAAFMEQIAKIDTSIKDANKAAAIAKLNEDREKLEKQLADVTGKIKELDQ